MSEQNNSNNLSIKSIKKEIALSKKSISKSIKFENLKKDIENFFSNQDASSALNALIYNALRLWSSDVHIDAVEQWLSIRYRIDWILIKVLDINKRNEKLLVERIKFKTEWIKLNIFNLPQDWRFKSDLEDWSSIDVRVSIIPSKFWENITFRILNSTKNIPNIKELWLSWTSKHSVIRSLSKKSWLILVTWPTWSGKTTTLYSMLDSINDSSKKIITLENPIEYILEWIIQSEIDDKIWYTFQNWLKSVLRQDPDVIMIWEIRTLETAKITARAALTWHLVFSTLHTNNAAETIETLINMWVEPYIMAWSIDIIISQRLVRRVCDKCSYKTQADDREKSIISWMIKDLWLDIINSFTKDNKIELVRAKWCPECSNSWYKWRIWIFEVISFNSKIKKAIREWASTEKIIKLARENDMILMREDGIIKAIKWLTTLEELFRVID